MIRFISRRLNTHVAAKEKPPIVKSYRINELLQQCAESDAVFGRAAGGHFQYFAWPGLDVRTAAVAVCTMPDTIRTAHSIFGRPGVAMDIAADVDAPLPGGCTTAEAAIKYQKECLETAIHALHEEVKAIGETVTRQIVFQSPNFKKVSFHIHAQLGDAVFSDYRDLGLFMQRVKRRDPHYDTQIYRVHGSLRMFQCKKEDLSSPLSLYSDNAFHIGFSNGQVPHDAACVMSLCMREPGTWRRKIQLPTEARHFASSTKASPNDDFSGILDSLPQKGDRKVAIPLTADEAVLNAKHAILALPEELASEWKSWIAVGLSAHKVANQFADAKIKELGESNPVDELLKAWIGFSQKCPGKFRAGECEKQWESFYKKSGSMDWFWSYRYILLRSAFVPPSTGRA